MNVIDFIRTSLDVSKQRATSLLEDMQDAPLTTPSPEGGNHPLWILGHLVYSESALFDQAIHGRANRFAEWAGLFAPGSTPVADAGLYPAMSELFARWDEIRGDVVAHLETLSEADLDQNSHAPESYGPLFATVGGCLNMLISHPHFHAGQAADARRAAGKERVFL